MKKLLKFILPTVVIAAMAGQLFAALSSPSVSTTAAIVVAADSSRMWWAISNNGTNAAYLKFDDSTNALTVTNGFYLAPGAAISIGPGGGAGPAQNAIWAITSTNTTALSFQASGQR